YGLLGDEVSDTKHHGGVDKALFANAFTNYPKWAKFLGQKSLNFGALGENLTIEGLDEKSVHIGDIHIFGEVTLQVSQPRKPCYKISRCWHNLAFTQEIYESGLTGWYYRVLSVGSIGAPCEIIVKKIDEAKISILDANRSFRNPKEHKEICEILSKHEALADAWKNDIIKRYKTYDTSFPSYMQDP
ncbi:MAG: MOSC domain-containing protein, partial [Campylobacteraceae bacterium]|nr:MOSC domain-containing protein [Campylobacteraceae bacterium]